MLKRIIGKWIIITAVSLALGSCQERLPEEEKPQSPFFDLKSFFQQEVDRLQAEQPSVKKIAMIGGQVEEHDFDQLNYQDELKVFLDSDINRASWWDRYQIDSTLQNGQLAAISYQALSEKLKTRSLELQFAEGKVSRVTIENQTKSPTVTFFQQLTYDPEKGYTIFTRQNVTMSPQEEMRITVAFK